ncbi:metal ABC transporter permease [Miltoncostaea oceani]|uniref:metal ABC transporter permease n=1 Tax=Miltoncostaea oceani TaxID=2843216 RepID=UPI001C3DEE07|nr:iron chelate uptake ABC transporter family permease subunit [Miltoncostaea oceani]
MGAVIDLIPLPYTDAVVVLGAMVLGIAAGVLGAFAVLPQRSLVGDALAHSALPGVAVAFLVTGAKDPASLLVGAAIAGMIGALMMVGIERTSRIRPDAAIGVVLSSFFSLGVVLLTYISGTGNAQQAGLETYLFGQAAGLLERDVAVMAGLAAAAVACVAIAFRPLKVSVFDRDFAASVGLPVRLLELGTTALLVVAIVIGLRAVGAILMVAMLIVPTVAARQFTHRLALLLPLAGAIGAGVGITGALLSSRAEVPTGPVIVLTGTVVVLAAVLLAPGRGVLWQGARRRGERRAARSAGVLVDLETAVHAGAPPTLDELAMSGARPRREVRRGVRDLDRAGLIERDGDRLRLSEAGAAAAHAALEGRRLWSAWLEHGWRLGLPDAREPDPRDLRGSLGDEMTDRLLTLAGEGAR